VHDLRPQQKRTSVDVITTRADRSDRIRQLLEPTSIAIIGASAGTGVGAVLRRNLAEYGYAGAVYLVNPRYEQIAGERCYPAVDAIGAPVDLAAIAVPADFVPEAIAACVRAGVGAVVIMSAGFAEDVRGGGAQRQEAMDAALAGSDMVVCGPNSQGIFTVAAGIAVSFSGSVQQEMIRQAGAWMSEEQRANVSLAVSGGVAIIAQSGGLGFSIFARGVADGIGFSHVVSVGNEADLDVLECAQYLLKSPDVKVIGMYVEGFRRPEQLAAVAEQAMRAGKTIVVGKSGSTAAGSRATLSHTGHLAGDAQLLQAALRRFGIIEVQDQDELLDVCWALSTLHPLEGDNIGVVSISGGTAVWTADACERAGLSLPDFDEERRSVLAGLLPSFASIGNPIDITATATTGLATVMRAVADAPYLDGLILITTLQSAALLERDLEQLGKLTAETSKPLVFYSYTDPTPESRRLLKELGIPIFLNSTRAARALKALREVAVAREAWTRHGGFPAMADAFGSARAVLTERETTLLLGEAGFPVLRQVLAVTAEEAAAAAQSMPGPVALKIQAPSVPHKAAIGGVMLGPQGADEVRRGFEKMMSDVAPKAPDLEGILVQQMAPVGLEMLVGIDSTAGFGPAIMLGFGGSDVERVRDAVIEMAPLTREDARAMVARLRNSAVLTQGLGTGRRYAVDALVEFLVAISTWAMANSGEIDELDINPLLVSEDGLVIVDSLLVKRVRAAPGSGND
jgi:acyl-CoA synthetase (NDP forming)